MEIDNASKHVGTESEGSDQKKSIGTEDLSTPTAKDDSLSNIDSQSNDEGEGDDEAIDQSCEFIGNALETFWKGTGEFFSQRSAAAHSVIYILLAVLYNAYFVASVYYSIHNGIPMDWCDGVGFLIVLTGITFFGLFYFQVVKKFWGEPIHQNVLKPIGNAFEKVWKYRSVPIRQNFNEVFVWRHLCHNIF
jgi:pyrimidine nucleoside transport protein